MYSMKQRSRIRRARKNVPTPTPVKIVSRANGELYPFLRLKSARGAPRHELEASVIGSPSRLKSLLHFRLVERLTSSCLSIIACLQLGLILLRQDVNRAGAQFESGTNQPSQGPTRVAKASRSCKTRDHCHWPPIRKGEHLWAAALVLLFGSPARRLDETSADCVAPATLDSSGQPREPQSDPFRAKGKRSHARFMQSCLVCVHQPSTIAQR